jgi:hypothetical protein
MLVLELRIRLVYFVFEMKLLIFCKMFDRIDLELCLFSSVTAQ